MSSVEGGPSREELAALLVELSRRQLEFGDDHYLRVQTNNSAAIRRKVDSFCLYRPHVIPGRVLDWGCRHGADSALLRRTMGDAVELHGCDRDPEPYEAFAAYSGITYTPLTHPHELPYADGSFDDVVASGVLEHVSHPEDSLRELRRVLRLGGRLLVTFLPNLFSYTEIGAAIARQVHHTRRYTRRRIARQLRAKGLEPTSIGFHQVLPALTWVGADGGRIVDALRPRIERAYGLNARLERRFPFNRVASNLYVIAEAR